MLLQKVKLCLLNNIQFHKRLSKYQIRTPYNLILINLSIVEFLLSTVGVPSDVFALIHKGWSLGKLACYTSGSIVTTAGRNSYFQLSKNIWLVNPFLRNYYRENIHNQFFLHLQDLFLCLLFVDCQSIAQDTFIVGVH